MSIYIRVRVEDVRALAGAIALGSGAGLLVGAAFLAVGSPTKPPAPAVLKPTSTVQASTPPSPPAPPSTKAAAPEKAQVGLLASLRGRFSFDGSTHSIARPFQFPAVAKARTDLDCLTEAVYFEARGEEKAGQQAVAQVVLNRVRHPAFPKTICGVVHQHSGSGCQFSFACAVRREGPMDNPAWRRAQTIATAALHGAVMPAVGDATHFQTARSGPFSGLLKVAQIGAHIFYRFGGHAGAADMFRQTPAPSTGRMELAKADLPPSRPDAAKADVAKTDSAKAEAAKVGSGKVEAAKAEPAARTEPALKLVAAKAVETASASALAPTARAPLVAVRLVSTPTETKITPLPLHAAGAPAVAPPATAPAAKPGVVTVALAQG